MGLELLEFGWRSARYLDIEWSSWLVVFTDCSSLGVAISLSRWQQTFALALVLIFDYQEAS
jgi:hypothetical protein